MTYELNQKVKELVPYEPETGKYAVRLEANESFLPIHKDIKKDMAALIRKIAFNRYPDPKATECCKAFADYYGINPALVTAGNGSDELIGLILSGFFSRGEKLLIAEPDFSMYRFYAQAAELQVVSYQKTEDFRIDPQAFIELAQKENCRGLIFSNPCNPTSQGLKKGALRMILKALPDTLIILDEAYMDFWNQSILTEVEEYNNLIILRTCSKAMGGAAIRLGFAVCRQELAAAVQALKSPYNVDSLTQAAGLALLKRQDILKDALADILAGRGFLAGALTKLEQEWQDTPLAFSLVPESKTNFLVLRFRDKSKHQEIADYLKRKKILIRCFPDFLRITVGSPEENQALLAALRKMAGLKKYQKTSKVSKSK